MWTQAFLGLGCGAALVRALLVLECKVCYRSNSLTTLIHVIFHPQVHPCDENLTLQPISWCIATSQCAEDQGCVPSTLKVHNFSVLCPN